MEVLMWKLLILVLFIFTNNPAYSLVQNVSIQCRADGPIYSGKIEYAALASDWRITQVTQKECLLETQVPLRIEFNGMIYQKTSISETYFIQPDFTGRIVTISTPNMVLARCLTNHIH